MYKSFEIVRDFIEDLYGVDFLQETMDSELTGTAVGELKNAHRTIMTILSERRKPVVDELVRDVYPLLEVAVQWWGLKKEGKLAEYFMERCRERVSGPGNFYGTIFEIDMASRCILSNWAVEFVEDCNKEGVRQIDFVVRRSNQPDNVVGVECRSQRFTEALTIDKIQQAIDHHADKFAPEHIAALGYPLHEKVLVVNLTRGDYSPPEVIADLESVQVPSDLDSVVFTWREHIADGDSHSLLVRYKTIGSLDDQYFSVTYAAEFRKGPVFFMRKYVYPEPTVGIPGPEERAPWTQ